MTAEVTKAPSTFEAMIAAAPAEWPRALSAILSDHVQDALHGKKSDLQALSALLVDAVQRGIRTAPANVRDAVLSGDASNPVAVAYHLGQLSFAQLLISQVANRRVDDDFAEFVNNERYVRIAKEMAHDDHSLQEIRARTSLTMSDLTNLGAQAHRFSHGVSAAAARKTCHVQSRTIHCECVQSFPIQMHRLIS